MRSGGVAPGHDVDLVAVVVALALGTSEPVQPLPATFAERMTMTRDPLGLGFAAAVDTLDAGVDVTGPPLAGLAGVRSTPADEPMTRDAHDSEDRTCGGLRLGADEDGGEAAEGEKREQQHEDPLPGGKGFMLLLLGTPWGWQQHGLRGLLRRAGAAGGASLDSCAGEHPEDPHERQRLEAFPDADHCLSLPVCTRSPEMAKRPGL